ncbi:MAG: molecular chaperone TorD family protein [Nitrospinota bacterium]
MATEDLDSLKSVYLFLARIYLEEVDAGFLSDLRSEEMTAVLKSIEVDLSGAGLSDKDFLESLAAEYAAIFIAPGSKPPYQSVLEEGRYMADAVDKTEAFYQEHGFEYRKEYPNLFPDHLGLQLSFMGSLIDGEVKALKGNNSDDAAKFGFARKEFFEKNLGKWFEKYLDEIISGVKHPFYQSIIEFTRAFLDNEAESLSRSAAQ